MWRQIPGFPEFEAHSDGAIRRVTPTLVRSRWGGYVARFPAFHELKQTVRKRDGYRVVTIFDAVGKKTVAKVHRLICLTFNGTEPSGKHQAAHRNDDKGDNSAVNLYWATSKENGADKIRNGRQARGSVNGRSLLSEHHVRMIRFLLAHGDATRRKIANMFGVSRSTVSAISTGQNWGWLQRGEA